MHELELQVIYDKHLCRELTNENNVLKESNRALEAENQLLKQVLENHGIAYPNQNEPLECMVASDEGLDFANGTQISAPPSAISQFSLPEPNQNNFHDSTLLLDPSFSFADGTNLFSAQLHENTPLCVPEQRSFSLSIKCDLQVVQRQVSVDLVNVSLSFVLKSVPPNTSSTFSHFLALPIKQEEIGYVLLGHTDINERLIDSRKPAGVTHHKFVFLANLIPRPH